VQLEDILAARRLMQPVDILRDDSRLEKPENRCYTEMVNNLFENAPNA
jgi:hypothetical protein